MNNKGREPVILAAARTPIGRFRGMLRDIPAPELGAHVVREAVRRAGLADGSQIDEVLMGNVVAAGLGQAPARQAAIGAGLPPSVGATTLNKVCGSGLKAGMFASQAIKAGDADLIVAGGMESMSRAPFLVRGRGGELDYGHQSLEDSLLLDGLWDPFEQWAMGMAAEYIADEYEVTREAMDRWALDSHRKAAAAQDAGKFEAEIVSVKVAGDDGKTRMESRDETLRRDSSLEKLAALTPVFRSDGRVTAGNSPGLNDGAAAVVYSSREKATALGLKPIARVVGYAQAAVAPKEMFIAPARVIPSLLAKVGWTPEQLDLIELNEAFAAQVLADGYALSDTGWDWERVNVHGGAIALGHPLGASGARILTTLIYALQDRGLSKGIASLCLGGGEAVAMAIELEEAVPAKKILVVGAGTMGHGIAQTAAVSGYHVILSDVDPAALERGKASIEKSAAKLVGKGVLSAEQLQAARSITTSTNLEPAAEVDLVIEAATENPEIKFRIFAELDRRAPPAAVLASNTSSISITRIGAATARPDRVIGMHFFNPVPLMTLLEVIRGLHTSEATLALTMEVGRRMGKQPVQAKDSPGFIANRILCPMINEAIFALQENLGTAEDIDTVMKLGMSHPIGPLALADLIGLDVLLYIMQVLHRDLGDDKYRPAPLLRQMVDAGLLGRKAGAGFFQYPG